MIYNSQAVPYQSRTAGEAARELIIGVWREICRRPRLDDSLGTIAGMLAELMPLAAIGVLEFDNKSGCLETIATAAVGMDAEPPRAGKIELSPREAEKLLACRAAGGIFHGREDIGCGALAILAERISLRGDLIAGPLAGSNDPLGFLWLEAERGRAFNDTDVAAAKMLLEPFAAALVNHRRYHEMFALQAAAEADKRSLLTRLGRKELVDAVVGADSGLVAVMQRVELVARSNAPVLILGETGTGKELIAREIHRQSPRSEGPFIRVNCGAIPPELVDSHLFGHEKGAFTGAIDTRRGWFEQADGGTLLLDEIGELPPAAQVRLLRILQDGWLERVGGRQQIKVDVRIVAATHRDLAEMIAEKKFRADLWYRIAVFPLAIPSLRERVEDIPALANHFARRAATRFVLPLVLPAPQDIELLSAYSWPGNIRELASVIDRAAILGNGKHLEVEKALGLAPHSHAAPPADLDNRSKPSGRVAQQPAATRENMSLDAVVKRHIEAVLSLTNGRIEGRQGAAELLQINPHTLRGRMRKLGIDWSRFREEP